MDKIRMGVVGVWRGLTYCETYAKQMENVQLVAVCDSDPGMRAMVKEKLPENVQIFEDYDAFLECGLDAIVLCNFFHEHAKLAIPALKKGISVLSETTAAPTMGECVALCEAVEESGAKYMLGTNVPHMFGCADMAKLYQTGKFGRVLYAEGEYFHTASPEEDANGGCGRYDGDYHWRRYLPRTYYNMHDLGTLMIITGTMPKKVNAKAVFAPDIMAQYPARQMGDVASVILTEMDNRALFRTTSCAHLGPNGKWFRLACENGSIETLRGDQDSLKYTYNNWCIPEGEEATKTYDARPENLTEEQKNAGHGGSDYFIARSFVDYLLGKTEPFFNVYRSVALSAAGILAWRSVLEDGREFTIPDFTDKQQRAAYANDFLTPFPNYQDGSGITLPCSSKPYTPPEK